VCPTDTILRLGREMQAMQEILQGDETPGQEKDGLIPIGTQLVEQLKKIGQPQ